MTAAKVTTVAVLAGLIGLGAGWWWFRGEAASEHETDGAQGEHAVEAPESGKVELDAATVERLGIHTAPIAAVSLTPTFAAPGMLESDPAFEAAVRAPLAGRVAAMPDLSLRVGDAVAKGAVVATLQPQLSAAERADFAQRRAQAVGDQEAATQALAAAKREWKRLSDLHADGNAASERAVEQAEVEVKTQEARLSAAQAALQSLPADGPTVLSLIAPMSGIVDAMTLRDGETVDAGALLVHMADPSHLLVRVEVPAAADVDELFERARVELLGAPPRTLDAERAAWVDSGSGGRGALLRLTVTDAELRAGLPVTAHLPRTGGAREGLLLPESAIVRRSDGAYVYVRDDVKGGDTVFHRLPVTLDAPAPGGWLTLPRPAGPKLGADLVIDGAGTLLSVERQRSTDAEEGG